MTRSRNPEAPAYVYIVAWRASGPIRIGYTTSVPDRLSSLQTSSPFALRVWMAIRSKAAVSIEKACHKRIKHMAMQGEWFDCAVKDAMNCLRITATDHDIDWTLWHGSASPKWERERKLYLAGGSRQQVMRKHRPIQPAHVAPKPLSKADKAREQAALDEWQYLNRD